MNDILIKILPANQEVRTKKGSYLIDVLYEHGFIIPSSCGKRGICGKCLVEVEYTNKGNENSTKEKSHLLVNSCQYIVEKDIAVSLPQVQIDKQKEIYKFKKPYQIKIETSFNPNIQVLKVNVEKEEIKKSKSYQDYFFSLIGKKDISLEVLKKIACIKNDITKSYNLIFSNKQIIDIKKEREFNGIYGIAIDLGTTSIAIELINLMSGENVGDISELNPQILYGDDVISRISYAIQSEDNTKLMQKSVVSGINNLNEQLVKKIGITQNDIYDVVVAGNTTMIHLLLGIDPSSLGEYPFTPTFLSNITIPPNKIGIHTHPEAQMYIYPAIGGFVGGDITAGLLAINAIKKEKPFLFVDLGTNGEIVIAKQGLLYATSTAVGPAFEGVRIQCGMRASIGAIEKITLNNDDIDIKVIGNIEPLGICGSALIDLLAILLRLKIINTSGRMLSESVNNPNVPEKIRKRVKTNNSDVIFEVFHGKNKKIFLSSRDVRQLQLSCSAIKCGIKLLAKEADIGLQTFEKIYIAGTFGFYLNRKNLKTIGIIPEEINEEKIEFVGNSSLAGAKYALINKDLRNNIEEILGIIKHIDLSTIPEFEEEFAMSTFFPESE
ncbi:MAG TPA: ASKHA domain-containing protein [Candidatus Hydrogenedens sp.]|nr:ASKHA domain-containing protein [Candidatus Hydrogenedens sp.]